jgi:hypothetical protein
VLAAPVCRSSPSSAQGFHTDDLNCRSYRRPLLAHWRHSGGLGEWPLSTQTGPSRWSEAKIVELKKGRSTFYVHREAVLEQLRLTDESEAGPPREPPIWSSRHAGVTLEDVRPIYERLKTEQGGISTVKIYDIMTRLGAA